jgi:hypothetical protein
MRSLATLPKTDLHLHFQVSARADTVRELQTADPQQEPSR